MYYFEITKLFCEFNYYLTLCYEYPYAYNSMLGLEQGKDYVCKLDGQDNAYHISQNHVLYVEEKSFKGDCKKLNAFKQLQQDLYHYQALQK